MNILILLIAAVALIALAVNMIRSFQQPDPLEEMTRSHRLARPGDEPVFLIRTSEADPPKQVTEKAASDSETLI